MRPTAYACEGSWLTASGSDKTRLKAVIGSDKKNKLSQRSRCLSNRDLVADQGREVGKRG